MAKEYVYFKEFNSKDIKECNSAEIHGFVIQKFAIIETLIDSYIIKYFEIKKESIFRNYLLNTSVMHFGGKRKILKAIGIDNQIYQGLGKIMSIRNAFAHSIIRSDFDFKESIKEGESLYNLNNIKEFSTIEVLNGEGILKTKNAYDELKSFDKLCNEVIEHLQRKVVK